MLRNTLVMVHAAAGVGGLLLGLSCFAPPRRGDNRAWQRRLYLLCLAALLAGLVALVAIDWAVLNPGSRLAFSALIGLGAFMIYRIIRAYQMAGSQGTDWQRRYIAHIYFTYISLWVGLLILPALKLPYAQLSVPLVVVVVLAVGGALIIRYKRRTLAT